MIETPVPLAEAIEAELASERLPLGREIAALEELHRLFTTGRSDLAGLSYLDVPRLRRAYLRYYLPLNAARAACAMESLRDLGVGLATFSTIVDLGAGPGSATAAALLEEPGGAPARVVLYDRSRAALRLAGRILRALGRGAGGSTRIADLILRAGRIPAALPRFPGPTLLLVSTVLNELHLGHRRGPDPAEFLEMLGAALEPGSLAVFVEPALRVPARNLLRLHDAAVRGGEWTVLAPCTHQRPCPLLRERDRPWCHFRFAWRPPEFAREVAEPLGLDWTKAFLSFLALRRGPPDGPRERAGPRIARAIGDPMAVRGGKRGIYVCEGGRRLTLAEAPRGSGRGDVIERGSQGGARVRVPWVCRKRGEG